MTWPRLWRRRQRDEQIARELRFHLDEHTAELVARGHDPVEARRQAQLALGGAAQVSEGCRDERRTRWFDDVLQDARYALRSLRRQPGFAAVTLCTLALGTGATSIMFSVVNGVLLKPLAYPNPERLVVVREETDWSSSFGNRWAFAYPNYLDCRREARGLALGAWRYAGGTVTAPGDPEYVDAREVSADMFSILGIAVQRGRALQASDDRPGADPVAVISDGLWRRHYQASTAAIGSPLVFAGTAYVVVGVVAPGMRLSGDADVLTPLGRNAGPRMENRDIHPGIQVWGRLRDGVALSAAQADLASIGRSLASQYPASNRGRTFVADALRPDVGEARVTLWLLLGAVCVLLLIACTNVASLLLARATFRERELAMRVALGAGRGRLIRQCLTESAVLSLCGGALGVALAAIGLRPFVLFWPGSLPRADAVSIDGRVLLFAFGVSIASGLLFGLAPALRAPAGELEQRLRAGARAIAGTSRRLHAAFVVTEIALAVVLLVSAGMLGRTLLRLSSLDPGVNIRNVLVARMALSPATLASPERTRAAWSDALDRARRLPGVRAAATVDTVPMRMGDNQLGYSPHAIAGTTNRLPLTLATSVTPDYLNVMGLTLRKGRFIDDRDRLDAAHVIVIDDVLARNAFASEEPVGKRLWIPLLDAAPVEVVGVVNHVRHWGLASDDQANVRAQFYYPFAQVPDRLMRRWSELTSIAVRTDVAPLTVVEPLRRALRGGAGDQVLYEVRTMDQLADGTLAQQRFLLLLFSVFAALALLLACLGIYGVLAYLLGQRIPEIGVRMALGATAARVVGMVFQQSLWMIGAGVGVGTLAAWGAARVLQRLVAGMEPADPLTFGVMVAVLVAAALLASVVPARRASRVEVLTALRHE